MFFSVNASYLVVCGCLIMVVIKQNVVIFNLASTLEDIKDEDEGYDNKHVH